MDPPGKEFNQGGVVRSDFVRLNHRLSPAKEYPLFNSPQVNLYSRDLAKALAFYESLGFIESFRTPSTGDPIHVELKLDGFTLGIATIETAQHGHGLTTGGEGRWIEIVVWTDDTDAAIEKLAAEGAPVLSAPHDWLDGRIRLGWVADPDGNPIQIVQRKP